LKLIQKQNNLTAKLLHDYYLKVCLTTVLHIPVEEANDDFLFRSKLN